MNYPLPVRHLKRQSPGKKTRLCSVEGCGRLSRTRGFCAAHYGRWRASGDVKSNTPFGWGRSGAANGNWKGGQIEMDGRVLLYRPDHPHPNLSGLYVFRYRLVMEEKLGRFLSPDEIVHHRNGVVNDDVPNNLYVTSQSDHAKLHNINGRFSTHSNEPAH